MQERKRYWNYHKSYKSLCCIGFILLFALLHHFLGYFGHYGYDDVQGYAKYASIWVNGQPFFLNEDFFSYRWGFIALTSLSYACFGVGDHASAVVPILVLLATVGFIFIILKKHPAEVAIVAAILCALDPWTMYYSDKIMPDTTVALTIVVAFYLLHQQSFATQKHKKLQSAFLFTTVLFFGYLTKQSILLLFPVFLYLFVLQYWRGEQRTFWNYTILCCVLFGLAYLALIAYLTGDPFMRFRAVEAGLEDNLGKGRSFAFCNYAIQPWSALWNRIFYEMPQRFLSTGMLTSMAFALPALWGTKWWQAKNSADYWKLVAVGSALAANFMTTSYKAYLPICPDIRHFLFLIPLFAVVAARKAWAFLQKKEGARAYLSIFALVTTLAFYLDIGNMKWLYAFLWGLMFLRVLLPVRSWATGLLSLGAIVVLSLPILSSMKTARASGYAIQRAIIYEHLKPHVGAAIVLCNPIQAAVGHYLMEYDSSRVRFVSYQDVHQLQPASDAKIYILANAYLLYLSRMTYGDLPPLLRAVYENKQPASVHILERQGPVLLLECQWSDLVD